MLVKYGEHRCKQRGRIETMSGCLKDRPGVAACYDRCPKAFLSTIALAALVIYGLRILNLAYSAVPIIMYPFPHALYCLAKNA